MMARWKRQAFREGFEQELPLSCLTDLSTAFMHLDHIETNGGKRERNFICCGDRWGSQPAQCLCGVFFFLFKKKNFFSNNTWNLHKIWNFWCNDERINLVWNYLSPLFKFFHDWYVCVLLQPRCILLVFIAYNHFIFEMVYVLYIGEIVSFLETNFSIVKW